jgi:hypothetical protein
MAALQSRRGESQHTGIVRTTANLPVRELRAIYGGWALWG